MQLPDTVYLFDMRLELQGLISASLDYLLAGVSTPGPPLNLNPKTSYGLVHFLFIEPRCSPWSECIAPVAQKDSLLLAPTLI